MPMPRFAAIAAGTALSLANACVWVALVAAGFRIVGDIAPHVVLLNVAGLVFATSCAALWLLSASGASEAATLEPVRAHREPTRLRPRSL